MGLDDNLEVGYLNKAERTVRLPVAELERAESIRSASVTAVVLLTGSRAVFEGKSPKAVRALMLGRGVDPRLARAVAREAAIARSWQWPFSAMGYQIVERGTGRVLASQPRALDLSPARASACAGLDWEGRRGAVFWTRAVLGTTKRGD